MEPMIGFEPMTCSLRMSCTTAVLHWLDYGNIIYLGFCKMQALFLKKTENTFESGVLNLS